MTKNEWHDWADDNEVFNVPAIRGHKGAMIAVILANGLWFFWEREWELLFGNKGQVQQSPPWN